MKTIILLAIIAGTATSLFGGAAEVKLQTLQNSQKKLITAKHKLRVKLITSDAEIKRLHRRIMALHKELAIKINEKKSMKLLIAKQKDLEAQIVAQEALIKAAKKINAK